ncbi:MAG: cytochrome c [Chloroflexi bacterium]|nr:cytochrome c [Chloroflexota bacterium]
MRHFFDNRSLLKVSVLLASAIFTALMMVLFAEIPPVKALPEYSSLTGESCGVCHVNPGGGGPRTLRGLLWAARGKPVQLPALPTMLLAPDVQDGIELYGIACAGCHGAKGEGSSAIGLAGTGISAGATRSYLLKGIQSLGMPGFKGQLTDAQVDGLVDFVTNLADSKVPPPPDSYPLAPAQLHGKPAHPQTEIEGN